MARDASLDDFLDHGGDGNQGDEGDDAETHGDDGAPADGEGRETATADAPVESSASEEGNEGVAGAAGVEPARATYEWSPAGAACGQCGAVVERRWRDGEAMVCAGCKEW